MKSERISKMEAYILENRHVALETLCREFGVSINTVRRDVAELTAMGACEKVYGGVEARQQNLLVPFEQRNTDNPRQKERIGRLAAGLISDGDVIFVDSGTTTLCLAPFLAQAHNVTVITHNVTLLVQLLHCPAVNVISLPGTLQRKTSSFIGPETAAQLRKYNFNKAFMAAAGLSVGSGLTHSSPDESRIKLAAVEKSEFVCLMADSAKFDRSSLMTYAQFPDLDVLVTDAVPPPPLLGALTAAGVRLLTGDPPPQ